MKFLPLIVFLFCLATSSLSTDPAADRFERYQSLSRLGPIDLGDSSYEDLISKPRDYHVAVILTATEARYGCILCRGFQSEWELIARSWNKGPKPEGLKLLFGTLDFSNGKGTFQKVRIVSSYMIQYYFTNGEKLMLQTAPVVLVYPPTTGPFAKLDSTPLRFDFNG